MRRSVLALLALLVTFGGLVSAASAQVEAPSEDDGSTSGDVVAQDYALLQINRVEASGSTLRLHALADSYSVAPDSVDVAVDGQQRTVSAAGSAASSGEVGRVIFVVDASERLLPQNALSEVVKGLKSSIEALPSGVQVSVIRAGERPVVVAELGSQERAISSLSQLQAKPGAAVYDGIRRAGEMLGSVVESGGYSSVVVVTGGEDETSTNTLESAMVPVLNNGIQLVAVRYQGGDPAVTAKATESGGTTFSAAEPSELAGAITTASGVAGDRLIVETNDAETENLRPSLTLRVGDNSESISYRADDDVWRPALLVPPAAREGGGFFATRAGFYIVLAMAFVGITLGVYAAGSLFAGGDASLNELIERYSSDVEGTELSDSEQAVVQTALVQRATGAAEAFAANRGFLVKVETMLEKANLPLRPGEAMTIYAIAVLAGAIIGFVLAGPLLAVVFGVLFAVIGIGVLRYLAARRMKRFVAQLPDALQLLAGTLKAGYSLPQGLEAVSHEIPDPMGYELRRVMTEARLGRELEDALTSAADRLESPDFAWAVMAIAIQREVGGNLAELLTTVAQTMIARERMRREVAALTAEGRMSAFIIGGLPPGLGFMMWVIRPEYINPLFTTTLGNVFIGAALVSMTVGAFWMKKVITINV